MNSRTSPWSSARTIFARREPLKRTGSGRTASACSGAETAFAPAVLAPGPGSSVRRLKSSLGAYSLRLSIASGRM